MDANKPARTLKIREEYAVLILAAIIGKPDQMADVTPEQKAKVCRQSVEWADALCVALNSVKD